MYDYVDVSVCVCSMGSQDENVKAVVAVLSGFADHCGFLKFDLRKLALQFLCAHVTVANRADLYKLCCGESYEEAQKCSKGAIDDYCTANSDTCFDAKVWHTLFLCLKLSEEVRCGLKNRDETMCYKMSTFLGFCKSLAQKFPGVQMDQLAMFFLVNLKHKRLYEILCDDCWCLTLSNMQRRTLYNFMKSYTMDATALTKEYTILFSSCTFTFCTAEYTKLLCQQPKKQNPCSSKPVTPCKSPPTSKPSSNCLGFCEFKTWNQAVDKKISNIPVLQCFVKEVRLPTFIDARRIVSIFIVANFAAKGVYEEIIDLLELDDETLCKLDEYRKKPEEHACALSLPCEQWKQLMTTFDYCNRGSGFLKADTQLKTFYEELIAVIPLRLFHNCCEGIVIKMFLTIYLAEWNDVWVASGWHTASDVVETVETFKTKNPRIEAVTFGAIFDSIAITM